MAIDAHAVRPELEHASGLAAHSATAVPSNRGYVAWALTLRRLLLPYHGPARPGHLSRHVLTAAVRTSRTGADLTGQPLCRQSTMTALLGYIGPQSGIGPIHGASGPDCQTTVSGLETF